MKNFLVVFNNKSYVVKGKFIEYGSSSITIIGDDKSTVLVAPHGTMVVDLASLDEEESKKREFEYSIA